MVQKLLVFCVLLTLLSCSPSFLSQKSLTDAQYNEALAQKFWNLCMGSYCKPSRISSWNLEFVSDLYPRVTDITVIINSTGNAAGFTAYNPDANEVMIVFRGIRRLLTSRILKSKETSIQESLITEIRCHICR